MDPSQSDVLEVDDDGDAADAGAARALSSSRHPEDVAEFDVLGVRAYALALATGAPAALAISAVDTQASGGASVVVDARTARRELASRLYRACAAEPWPDGAPCSLEHFFMRFMCVTCLV